jgi:hypothetical protein
LLGGEESVPGRRTLSLLIQLLQYDNDQVKTHATAALYNLLADPSMREEAREMDLATALTSAKDDVDERFERQVEFVIEILDRLSLSYLINSRR